MMYLLSIDFELRVIYKEHRQPNYLLNLQTCTLMIIFILCFKIVVFITCAVQY